MPDRDGEAPLFGPGGRIPVAPAGTLTRESRLTQLRKAWLPRHTVVTLIAVPLLFFFYSAAGNGFGDPLMVLLIAASSLVGALIIASYLPLRGEQRVQGAPCALLAALLVPAAATLLHQTSGLIGGVLALSILSLGLAQRVTGVSACG